MAFGFALITGASSGIGEAFARALPPETGLLLTGRDVERLAALKDEFGNGARRVEALAADLATEAGRSAVVEAARDLPIDLLVNNAGLGRFGAFADNPPEIEYAMAEVNVVAPVVLTRALLPGMIARARSARRRAGVIVVASTAAFAPLPYLSTYTATKAFDLFFAEGLAGEMANEPVDVLALCPGPTRSRFLERAAAERMAPPILAEPQRVAREGLTALGRKTVHVVGGANQAYASLTRFVPKRILRSGTRRYMRRTLGLDRP